jgi:hypothetical protein
MADKLTRGGPDIILNVINSITIDIDKLKFNGSKFDESMLLSYVEEVAAKVGGLEALELKLAEQMRLARRYATSGPVLLSTTTNSSPP